MKWFKHLTASGSDPDIGAVIDEFGFKGYYLFFRTVEVMSIEFDVENPGKNTFNFHWFLDQFPRKIDRKTLINFLNSTQKKRRIYYSLNGKDIHLNCPKLKDLTDEYTEKIVRQKSGQNPDKVPIKVGIKSRTKNKNKEIRSKNINKEEINSKLIKQIIDYFNKTTNQKRSYTCEETNKMINGRIEEGRAFKDFKHVIDTKTAQWLNDPKMRKFLRPSTLFRPGKFEDYLNEPYEDPKKKPEDSKKEEMEKFDEMQEKAMEERK